MVRLRVYVSGANNAANYWRIQLAADGVAKTEVTTAAIAGSTDASLQLASWAGSVASALTIECVKVGSPGALYVAASALLAQSR